MLADFQLAARGRAGLEWHVDPERDLAFSAVLRPSLAPQRDAWPYVVATVAIADVLSDDVTIRWPDEVWRAGARSAVVGVQVDAGKTRAAWVVVSAWLIRPGVPRAPLLGAVVAAVEERLGQDPNALLRDYRALCTTLGHRVRVRMSGLGAGERTFSGVARTVLKDGTLVVEGEKGRQMVPPGYLRALEHLEPV